MSGHEEGDCSRQSRAAARKVQEPNDKLDRATILSFLLIHPVT